MRGTAAEHAGPAVPDVRVAARLLGGGVVVVQFAAEQAHPAAQGEDFGAADVARAALDDGDGDVRVLGEAGGDHRAGGAAADHDVVVGVLVNGCVRGVPGRAAAGAGGPVGGMARPVVHVALLLLSPRTSARGAERGSGTRAWSRGTRPARTGPARGPFPTCRTRPTRPAAGRVEVVDPDGAVPQPAGHAPGAALVGRPDAAGESVLRVVGQFHGLFLGAEGLHRQHRAEDLLADHAHPAVAAVEHGGPVEEARSVGAFAAGPQDGALRQCGAT